MMPKTSLDARITPGTVGSLTTVYELTSGRTIPATPACASDQTSGTTP
jgi:hypothetical protein